MSFVEPVLRGDAEAIGEFDDELLDREIEISETRRGAQDRNWPSRKTTVEQFIQDFARHRVGKKDGPAILQGKAIEGQRKAASMEFLDILILDIDTGQPPAEIVKRIRELDLAAIVYSSHSHLKDTSEVGQDALMKWAEIDDPTSLAANIIVAYLMSEKGYVPSVLDTAIYEGIKHSARGLVCRLKHNPMPKFKIVLFLKERFVIRREAPTQREAINKWKELYAGTAALLNAHFDRTCVDPSRLQYTPRRPKSDDDFILQVIGGGPLDLLTVKRVPVLAKKTKDPFEAAGAALHKASFKTMGMGKFLAENANVFDIGDFFMEHTPDDIRNEKSNGMEVKCPNDDMHSNAGDINDTACMVRNGTENERGTGFFWGCHHEGCADLDRAAMLDMYLQENELTIADCMEHCSEICEELTPIEKIEQRIDALPDNPTVSQQKEVVVAIASINEGPLEEADLLDRLNEACGGSLKRALGNALKGAKNAARRAHREEVAQQSSRERISLGEAGFEKALKAAKAAIIEGNKREPFMFKYLDGIPARILNTSETNVKTDFLDKDKMQAELMRVTTWENITQDGGNVCVAPPMSVVSMLLADRDLELLPLKRIVRTPVFAGDGTLVLEPGYSIEAGVWYEPFEGCEIPTVYEDPTNEDVEHAKGLLLDNVLADFPFAGALDGQASRANALAMMLLPFCREMIYGPTPAHLVSKPTAGTGGSYLIEAFAMLTTGCVATTSTIAKREEEMKKVVTSRLKSGGQYLFLDNVHGKINSECLASVLTSGVWKDRLLGSSEEIECNVRWTMIIAGNNPVLSGELCRRASLIRLDSKLYDPTIRSEWKHKDLVGWIEQNRGELIAACLTLVQNWINKGQKPSGKHLASFVVWAGVMGGILEAAGIDGFIENLDDIKELSNIDSEAELQFIASWWEQFGEKPVKVGKADFDTWDDDEEKGLLWLYGCDEYALPGVMGSTPTQLPGNIGKWLGSVIDRRYPVGDITVKVTKIRDKTTHAYVLEEDDTATT